MKNSVIALKVLAAQECGIITTNSQFWESYSNKEKLEEELSGYNNFTETLDRVIREFSSSTTNKGIVSYFDPEFPIINPRVKNNSEKPYLLFYKGEISLLRELNKNVAVIGVLDPDEEIIEREANLIRSLVAKKQVIVSGLAKGCDTIAHKICLEESGETIAILPTPLNKIYPSENIFLAEEIVKHNGLLLSEYYRSPSSTDTSSRFEITNRLIKRDRLQAMFAKAIILIASYRKNEGDSGSRHAFGAARKYRIERYVMYNPISDENNPRFGLNKDLLKMNYKDDVRIITKDYLNHIESLIDEGLTSRSSFEQKSQLSLF